MRLDQYLTSHAHADSRSRAQAMIAAGVVRVNGRVVQKASLKITQTDMVEVGADPNPYVSRAALKLHHALEIFSLNPLGAVALDVGASTGGFTQVLLAHGAAHVIALDVGHGQLHESLRSDARITNLEGVNAKDLAAQALPPFNWVVSDVSFISLEKALPPALTRAEPSAQLVALIKPQFEAGKAALGKGGVIRDAGVHQACCDRISAFLVGASWQVQGVTDSPITGSDGNREFLIAARKT